MAEIFIEEIERFLLENIHLQGYAPSQPTDPQYPNWTLTNVPVTYHIPEGGMAPDFEHSIVSLFLYDMQLDTSRLQSDVDLVVSVDEDMGTVTTKKLPIPYKLYYQIDLWSLKQASMVKMVTAFQKAYPPRHNLAIPDSEGEVHDFFMELTSTKSADGRLWDTGTKQTEDRFFRRIFRYCIYADLDNSTLRTSKRVAEVLIDSKPID